MQFILKWLVMVSFFGAIVYFTETGKKEREIEAQIGLTPYKAEIERYLAKKSVAKAKLPAKGNVVFIDELTRTVDKFSDYTISPHNQPKDPKDVDSVILHRCKYEQVGSYTNGSRAMQHVCNFTVIDVASGAWSDWGEFRGTMPLDEIRRRRVSTSDETGGRAVYSFFSSGGLVSRGTAAL